MARVQLLEGEHVARRRRLRQLVVGSAFCLELGCCHLSEHSAEKIAGVQFTTLHFNGQRESVRLLVELGKLPARGPRLWFLRGNSSPVLHATVMLRAPRVVAPASPLNAFGVRCLRDPSGPV